MNYNVNKFDGYVIVKNVIDRSLIRNLKKLIKHNLYFKSKYKKKDFHQDLIRFRKEEIIISNIQLIKKIRLLYDTGFINKTALISLAIGLYQFTRPSVFEESYYFNESKRLGRHVIINKYLKGFIKNHSNVKMMPVV